MSQLSVFICQQCGNEFSKWQGKCSFCGEWNSLVETTRTTNAKNKNAKKLNLEQKTEIQKLTDIKTDQMQRVTTGISELNRVLGGGLVRGQVVLIAGEPGIGKSTLLLQLSNNLPKVLYISGEESSSQVAIRAERLDIRNKEINFLESTDIDDIINKLPSITYSLSATPKEQASLIIVDSIQTMSTADLTGLAGSVGQVRECAFRLLRFAKENNIPLILVGHVTKEGTVAGPAVLAHIVDTVLWFEGEKQSNLRLLRAVKNRFGPTDEVGIFSMEEKGLVSMQDPEKLFLDQGKMAVAGSAVSVLMEGTRSILIEIQSLVVPTKLPLPRRVVQGIDSKRLEMLLAVLYRRANIQTFDKDVFVNVVGGIKAHDPAIDLAVCASIASSYYNKPLPVKTVVTGEVGLLGEIRNSSFLEKRIKDAKRLGFKQVISPKDYKYLPQALKNIFK